MGCLDLGIKHNELFNFCLFDWIRSFLGGCCRLMRSGKIYFSLILLRIIDSSTHPVKLWAIWLEFGVVVWEFYF